MLYKKIYHNNSKSILHIDYNINEYFVYIYIGYYAEQLSSDDIVSKTDTGNSSTTAIRTTKTTKKSSHIYKLSYAGPIVMGVGGKYYKYYHLYDS